ncbi:EH domain-containing protein 2-like [Malania oleifera]|uniref:EH domain-containing protein 2-like n=1 Tax=Malania oleifera TaxID=397392 RepID=UPI0025AE4692|nr:EH domain-containing protein 2-like [Malania oleifera]
MHIPNTLGCLWPLLIMIQYQPKHCSFNDNPVDEVVVGPIWKELFEKEQDDLPIDLMDIPKKACERQYAHHLVLGQIAVSPLCWLLVWPNSCESVAAKIHAYIINHLKMGDAD